VSAGLTVAYARDTTLKGHQGVPAVVVRISGRKHPACGFITCCIRQRGIEACAECIDWLGCERAAKLLQSAERQDSFISYRPIAANFAFIQKYGIEEFARLEMGKQKFLRYLLDNYDEGRSKSFYCTACQLIPLDKLREALRDAEAEMAEDTDTKEKARIVRTAIGRLADFLQIDLKLRK